MSPAVGRALRWAVVGSLALFVLLTLPLIGLFGAGYLRNFHVPAEGMAPTFEKGDRFVALMGGEGDLSRGDVILLKVGEFTYVKRVAALAGDMIGLRDGIVILNGRPVAQRFLGVEPRSERSATAPARRLAEQFPGEAGAHEIFDMEHSPVDDAADLRVPAGFVFVLGNNRDRSADSRVPRDQMGVELLPVADVEGRPIFCTKGCELRR